MKIQIILGSTREGRTSETVGKWILEEGKKKGGFDIELLDLRNYPLPFFDEAMPPMAMNGNYKSPVAKEWSKKITEGDGYIIIAPEYNHGYPAVIKNALDYLYQEWNHKPVAFVGYGSVEGARSIEQLRQVVVQLEMAPTNAAIHIPNVWEAFDEHNQPKDATLNEKAGKFFDKLLWWTSALKQARDGSK